MYCPNCSQQQISDELRFCSRCGFPLSTVRELIATGGVLQPEMHGSELSPAFIGVRKGVKVILAGILMAVIAAFMTALNEDFAPLMLVPLLSLLIGFGRVLYGVFREDRAPRRTPDTVQPQISRTVQPISAARSPELPTARFVPPAGITEQRRTAEMVQPPSVSESTTRLLDEEPDSRRSK